MKQLVLGLLVGGALGAGAMALVSGDDVADVGSDGAAETTTVPVAELNRLREMEKRFAEVSSPKLESEGIEATMRARLEETMAVNRALKEQLDKARGAPAQVPATARVRYRFGLKGETPKFDGQDWSAFGGPVNDYFELLPDLRADWLASGMWPSNSMVKRMQPIQMKFMPLITLRDEVEGSGPMGPMTHPVVVANLVRSALLHRELPLSEAQEKDIAKLGDAWSVDWEKRKAGFEPETPALEKLIVEVQVKQTFLDGLRAKLTEEQSAALWTDDTRDRIWLDMFTPGAMFAMRQPLHVGKVDELPAQLTDTILSMAKAISADKTLFAEVGALWAARLRPSDVEPLAVQSPDSIFPDVVRLLANANAQLAAIREALSQGHLSKEQAAALRASEVLHTPYVVQPE